MSRTVGCLFRGLDALGKKAKAPAADLPIESVSLSLRDLTGYLHPPDEQLEHEDRQNRLRALKNRQNLFQEEVRRARRGVPSVAVALARRCSGRRRSRPRAARGAGSGEPGRCSVALPPSVGSSALLAMGMSSYCLLSLHSRPSWRCGWLRLTYLKTDSNVCVSTGLEGAGVSSCPAGLPGAAPGSQGAVRWGGRPGRGRVPGPCLGTEAPLLPFACIKFPCVISFTESSTAQKSSVLYFTE